MKTLTVNTPVGAFTRRTGTAYTHAVVWAGERMAQVYARAQAGEPTHGGVDARWAKDRGYGVTWHGTQAAAERAARAGYRWVGPNGATLVGVYPVEGA